MKKWLRDYHKKKPRCPQCSMTLYESYCGNCMKNFEKVTNVKTGEVEIIG